VSTKEADQTQPHSIEFEIGEAWPRDAWPYFNQYGGDYMQATMDLKLDEKGAVSMLMIYYWRKGRLPADDDFSTVLGTDKKTWRRMSEKVLTALRSIVHDENKAGLIHQRKKSIELSKQRSEAGRKGGKIGGSRPRFAACKPRLLKAPA
jgi:uncharacterized protein YdaU (DUF1376 family)